MAKAKEPSARATRPSDARPDREPGSPAPKKKAAPRAPKEKVATPATPEAPTPRSASPAASGVLRIRLVRSPIGFSKHQKAVVAGLGLRKLQQVVERQDTPEIRGMVAKVSHLVSIIS